MVINEETSGDANEPKRYWLALATGLLALLAACGSSSDAVSTTNEPSDAAVSDDVALEEGGIDDPVSVEEPISTDEPISETIDDGSDIPPIDIDALTSQTWTLMFGSGPDGEVVLVDGYPLTLTFDGDGSFGGTAACNGYGGRYQIDGSEIFLPEIGSTDMGCEPDVQAAEGAFLSALMDATHINLTGEEMALSGPGSEIIFAPSTPASLEPLWGRSFTLVATLPDGVPTDVAGEEAILAIHPDDTFTATTGCRTVEGALVAFGNELISTEMSATGDCPSSLSEQDGHIIEVLGDGFSYELDDTQLLLSSAGNIGLHYQEGALDGVVDAPDAIEETDLLIVGSTEWFFTGGDSSDGAIPHPRSADAEATITLFLQDGEYSGVAICNHYGGNSQLDEFLTEVAIGVPEGTEEGCGDGLDEIISAYLASLPQITGAALESDGNGLVLTGSDVELLFEAER